VTLRRPSTIQQINRLKSRAKERLWGGRPRAETIYFLTRSHGYL
jgi:hypothetical protein